MSTRPQQTFLIRSRYSSALLWLCRKSRLLRRIAVATFLILEKGTLRSATLRDFLEEFEDVKIGHLSYGPIIRPNTLPRGTRIGAYCSIAAGLCISRRNHPFERISTHPLFYSAAFGLVHKEEEKNLIPSVESNPLTIGHDVWIGTNVIITVGCSSIGNGSIIAAGSVVTKDIPPYAIVGGIPAKVIKQRFTNEIIEELEASKWWERDPSSFIDQLDYFKEKITAENAKVFSKKIRD